MKVSTIVVNYKTPTDLHSFCASYDGGPDDELFVVNVDPTDDDLRVGKEWCEKLGGIPIHFTENVGYARAVNRAAMCSTGDILAIFNADVELRPGALARCAEALADRSDWGALGPLQVDRRGRCVHPGIFGTMAKPEWRPGGWFAPVQERWREVRDDAVTVVGSAHFFKADAWDELTSCPIYLNFCDKHDLIAEGAYLPTQHYYEETAANYHLHAHGWKVVYYGLVEIVHGWHQSSKVGGEADAQFPISQKLFREFCQAHEIPHD